MIDWQIKNWKWKYFTQKELICKGSSTLLVNEDAIDKLELMREILGVPMIINSAYRSKDYNRKVGGTDNSMHVQGRAFDISNYGHNNAKLYIAAVQAGFTGFGFYRNFLHVDTGKERWWGKKYRYLYVEADLALPRMAVISTDKETELPHKIEQMVFSDKQKIVGVATTATIATVSATAISENASLENISLENVPALLNAISVLDYRLALVLFGIGVIGWLIYFKGWWRRF